jgi:transposase
MEITTVGLDLAKNVFQVHAVSTTGEILVRKALRRAQLLPFFKKLGPCLVGMEACGTSHHWARQIAALGHEVKLMPPAYVKPYVKRGKTDASDAEAICEAVTRPTMRFVAVKSAEQQSALTIHRTRELLVRQRTQSINMMRGLLAEFGIVVPQGVQHALTIARKISDGEAMELPALAEKMARVLADQALSLHGQLGEIEREIRAWQKENDLAKRLATIPGIGPIGASALAATVTDPHQFSSGRQFAAWLGLTPLQNSSGGKERLGRISKMGDQYVRKILVIGMTAIVRFARSRPDLYDPWVAALIARKPGRLASVALANKAARVAWAIMTRGGTYRKPELTAAEA